jgi:predicted LPLAT superfamily acyltransferase
VNRVWTRQRERGSTLLLRFMIWLSFTFGWRAGRLLLYPITAYFLIFSRRPLAASRRFLAAALGRAPTFGDCFRHYFAFSSTLLDRPFLLTGRLTGYDIRVCGLEALQEQIARGRGCLLLGSHLGSFEVLRALADRHCPVPIKALMYEENAARANAVFNSLNPGRPAAVIPIGPPESMLRVKECLDGGELVGILGDRIVRGGKVVETEFLGRPAPFPVGPMILASALKAPVLLFYGLYLGARRYEIHFEFFADAIALRRDARDADLQEWVRRYAARLEHHARAYPYNWFNFYDFWSDHEHSRTPRGRRARPLGPARDAAGGRRGAGRGGRDPDRRAHEHVGGEEGEPRHIS